MDVLRRGRRWRLYRDARVHLAFHPQLTRLRRWPPCREHHWRKVRRSDVDVPWLLWEPWHMLNKPPSRRQFLRQVGVASLAITPLARPTYAQAKRQVTMRLDWLYQGPNAGFVIAQEKGFYEQ